MDLTKELCHDLKLDLSRDHKFRVVIKSGHLGCSDLQDACDELGFLVLYQSGDNYMIDSADECDNLCCVDDFDYICTIISTVEPL